MTAAAMQIADQIEACWTINKSTRLNIDLVARKLGVSIKDARSRLKLAVISPKIVAAFREGRIGLEQIEALTISLDHDLQERTVFEAVNGWQLQPEQIKAVLSQGPLKETHKYVVFVGLDAYEAEGGMVIRDLLAEPGQGLITNRQLLVRLAANKIDATIAQVREEGWKWVEAHPAEDPLYERIAFEHPLLTHGQPLDTHDFPSHWLSVSGAFVGINPEGSLRIERGLILPEDMEAARTAPAALEDASETAHSAPVDIEEQNPAVEPGSVLPAADQAPLTAVDLIAPDTEPSAPDQPDVVTAAQDSIDQDSIDQDDTAVVSTAPSASAAAAPAHTPAPANKNYRIQPGEIARIGSWKATAERNVSIVEITKQIVSEGRDATDDEKSLLTKYTGWGASEIANGLFGDQWGNVRYDWQDLNQRLKAALSDEEFSEAKRTTQYAHYTSEAIITGIFAGLAHMGFAGGSVLEPGMGIGLFNGFMPDTLAARSSYTGIEYDTITAQIARLLYPSSNIITGDFAKTALPRDFFDVAIGNPPFSTTRVLNDPEYKKHSFLLHDYFIAKSLDRVRPGGLVVLITSKGTMDKQNSKARRYMAARANLLGAIRLPQTAFKENAGTEVVTDVLFLQKRSQDIEPNGVEWLETRTIDINRIPATINQYFVDHPEMVLGNHAMTSSMYRGREYTVEPLTYVTIEDAFSTAVLRLPAGIYVDAVAPTAVDPPAREYNPRHRKEGGLYLNDDGIVMQVEHGIGVPLTERVNSTGKKLTLRQSELAWLKGFIGVRDALKRTQADQLSDGDWETSLKALNTAYDAFVKKHGPVLAYTTIERDNPDGTTSVTKRFKNEPLIRIDAEGALAYAMERIDEEGEIHKSAALQGRVLKRDPEPVIQTVQDALFVSLNRIGYFDLDHVAALASVGRQEAIAELGTAIYEDPAGAKWILADEYLSGDVVQKLKEAVTASALDPRFARNVEALNAVQPKHLAASDITVRLGANWIPPSDIEAFAKEIIGDRMQVSYNTQLGAWTVNCYNPTLSEWSYDKMNSAEILAAVLNSKQIKITWRDDEGRTHVDVEATEKGNDIAIKMREAFGKWIWTDAERAERLVLYYNENFNNIAPRHFDGSHLTLPGLSMRFRPYPHQKRAIWRIIQQGDTYLAHAVGAGKAQPLDAKVLTPRGWVRMGNIRPGDEVIAGDGTSTRVEAVYPQGEKDIYRVTFSDGSSTECCDEHLWFTHTYRERGYAQKALKTNKQWACAEGKVRRLSEIRATLIADHLGAKNHSIPMVGAVQFEPRSTPLDPYLLGVLLGDGGMTGSSVRFTCAEQELLGAISALLPPNCELQHRENYDYNIAYRGKMQYAVGGGMVNTHPVLNALRDMKLWGLTSHEKFIPDDYLFNSVDTRVAVLQGLMDTDGWVSKRGHSVFFTSTSRQLADGVAMIVQSLGGTVSIKEKRPHFTVNGVRKPGKTAYNVCLRLPAWVMPFRLARKANLVKPKSSYAPVRYIVAVEPLGRKHAQCIRISHPTHLYVTDDFIVTHNTMEMISAGMEQRRLGLIDKPMYVVPQHMLAQFAREFLELYPSANIMIADEHNFHTANRRRFVTQAALNGPDAIVITHSAFGRIGMSDDFYESFVGDQIAEWQAILADVDSSERLTRKQTERRIEALERRLEARLASESKDKVLTFEELGVDFLFIDEAHEFRKLDFASNQGNIKGIDPNGSQRALDLFMKVEYIRSRKPSRAIVMASGTPITNTMGELFTVQRFFQPDQLAQDGLSTFDAWAAQYGDVVAGFEQNAAGGYEIVSRFCRFFNVPELMRRVRSFMDILNSAQLGELIERPMIEGGQRQIVVTPAPDGYKAYQKYLETRIKAIRQRTGKPQPGDDIILSVIADGRFSAIDMRFVAPDAEPDPNSKLNRMLDDVIVAYHETADHEYLDPITKEVDTLKGATSIIFSDIGLGEQSAVNRGFDMKEWMRTKLIAGGIKPEHIAFMRDHKQHAKKERLFADMREGRKRVLIGGKDMETGVNVQKRLRDLFHLDAPWFPASVQQREGRIERQGNQNSEIRIRAYATKGSYDSTMWGMNARKARFIEQAMNGDDSVRSLDDVSEASAFQMASALASGDERYMKVAGLRADVERLERLRQAHNSEQGQLLRDRHHNKELIRISEECIEATRIALQSREPIEAGQFSAKVGSRFFDKRDDFGKALCNAMVPFINSEVQGSKPIGEIGGLPLVYFGRKHGARGRYEAEVYLDIPGDPNPLVQFPWDDDIAYGGIATRAINQLNSLEKLLDRSEDRIASCKRKLEQIKNRIGAPFPEEADLIEKQDQLKALEEELANERAVEAEQEAQAAAAAEAQDQDQLPTDFATADLGSQSATSVNAYGEEDPPEAANDDLSVVQLTTAFGS